MYHVRSVSFSDGGLSDRDIIFRDQMNLVFCFLDCMVKIPPREANNWRRRESKAVECVSFFLFSLPTVLPFFHGQTHTLTQTRKVRRDAERPKGDRD